MKAFCYSFILNQERWKHTFPFFMFFPFFRLYGSDEGTLFWNPWWNGFVCLFNDVKLLNPKYVQFLGFFFRSMSPLWLQKLLWVGGGGRLFAQ